MGHTRREVILYAHTLHQSTEGGYIHLLKVKTLCLTTVFGSPLLENKVLMSIIRDFK